MELGMEQKRRQHRSKNTGMEQDNGQKRTGWGQRIGRQERYWERKKKPERHGQYKLRRKCSHCSPTPTSSWEVAASEKKVDIHEFWPHRTKDLTKE